MSEWPRPSEWRDGAGIYWLSQRPRNGQCYPFHPGRPASANTLEQEAVADAHRGVSIIMSTAIRPAATAEIQELVLDLQATPKGTRQGCSQTIFAMTNRPPLIRGSCGQLRVVSIVAEEDRVDAQVFDEPQRLRVKLGPARGARHE